jgi:hypothetical protein
MPCKCAWLKIRKFSQRNIKRLRWENLGIFSQSQQRTYLVKSHNNTFRSVNWKILRLSEVLLQFTKKEGDECFDFIHGSAGKQVPVENPACFE